MIKKISIFFLALSVSAASFCVPHTYTVDTCFSPAENCTNKISEAIASAKKQIFVQSYSFTSEELANALIDAHKRGVDVRVYIDKGRAVENYSKVKDLTANGISVIVQKSNNLAHNKIMIIDEDMVITGSFNWTNNAKKNEENVNFITSPELVKVYLDNWNRIISNGN